MIQKINLYKKLTFLLILILMFYIIYIGIGYYIYATLAAAEPGCRSDCSNTPSNFVDNQDKRNFPFNEYFVDYWEPHQYPGGDEGIKIDAWWIPVTQDGPGESPVVICVHGLRISKHDADLLTVAGMLHQAGFNVLLFDMRDHGLSTIEDGQISIGTKEYRDVIASVDWLIDVQGIDAKHIGIYGDSMGAATAAIAFGLDQRIQAIVLDNGYLDLQKIVREELNREGLPQFLANGAVWAAWIFGNETLLEPAPELAFVNHENRQLFAMHGTADTRVLPHHTQDMEILAKKKGANLTTWFVENAGHSEIKYLYPNEFSTRLSDFFRNSL